MLSDEVKDKLRKWAEHEPLVTKAYVFGSRARTDYRVDSDLDIAVEIVKPPGDSSLLATWIFESGEMLERLKKLITEYKVDLQHFDGEKTPVISQGLAQSSYVFYERDEKAT